MDVSTTTAQDIIDSAFRRAKVAPQVVTAEMVRQGLQTLYHILLHYAGHIEMLWRLDTKPYGMYPGKSGLTLEANTINVLHVRHRTTASVGGTVSSSAGGSPTSGLNADEEDYFVQTSADGSVTIDAGVGQTFKVDTVGLMAYGDNEYNLVFEISDDGSSWRTICTILCDEGSIATLYPDRVWKWHDLDRPQTARYFRVRETSGGTLSFRCMHFGRVITEINLTPMNRDDYLNLPNKRASGRPLQYWKDRQQDAPVLWLWQTPDVNQMFNQIMVTRHAHVLAPELSDPIKLPLRWMELIKARLAYALAMEYAELIPDANWSLILENAYNRVAAELLPNEGDGSPTNYRFKLRKG